MEFRIGDIYKVKDRNYDGMFIIDEIEYLYSYPKGIGHITVISGEIPWIAICLDSFESKLSYIGNVNASKALKLLYCK